MSPALAPVALAALVLSACGAQSPAPPAGSPPATAAPPATATPPPATPPATPPVAPPVADDGWMGAGNGLSIRLDVPPGPYKVGATLELGLEFRNDGADDRRIYLIHNPVFRALQSDLTIFSGGKFLASQPDPHPHGYVVSERDFPAIPAGTTRRFTQPLVLDAGELGSVGEIEVRWTYKNAIESWAGGVRTLDGPTRPLFGGKPIPGIWVGEVKTAATLPLTR